MPYGQVSFVEALLSLSLGGGSQMSGIIPHVRCDAVMQGLCTCPWDKCWETSLWLARRMLLSSN